MGILLHVNFAHQLYRNTLVRSINNKQSIITSIENTTLVQDADLFYKHRQVTRRVQTNIDELQTSVGECRGVQTSHQTNIDQCRQVTRRVQTSVDQSLDECRQMQTSRDESKIFILIPEIVVHSPIFLLLQLCNSRPYRYANQQFYLLLLLIIVFSLPTLAKPICLFNVRDLELN